MKKIGSLVGLLLVVGLIVPVTLAAPAMAADPDNVKITLEGCRLGTFDEATTTCEDGDYTTGNLQPGWNEFDLVPHRLTLDAGNPAPDTQTYTLTIAFDNEKDGVPGYDRITVPVLNEDLSDASCQDPVVGPEQIADPGIGGADTTVYREVTFTQEDNTVCVYDYAGRLAIGASEYDGSSLHANVADEDLSTGGIGAKDVSIPVAAIAPQELEKDMSAVQNASVDWNITKGPQDAVIDFENVCNTGNGELTETIDITVEWTKLAAVPDDEVQVTFNVYATNPAHRDVLVDIEDTVTSGGLTVFSDTETNVLVEENTTVLVMTRTFSVPAEDVVGGTLHNLAEATYFDAVFLEEVPGADTAEADATVQTGDTANESVVITDSESISGTGLTFSVDSFSGATGSFDGGYAAGTPTVGPVGWTSDAQTDSGSVTFSKTVYLAAGTGATTGTLSDTATLTGESISKEASASASILSTASGSVTVNKSTTVPVDGNTTFTFDVLDSSNAVVGTINVEILDGQVFGTDTLGGLALGTYTLVETDSGGFTPVDPIPFSIALGDCDVVIPIENTFGPATASALKVTVPDSISPEGFEFTLFVDNDPVGTFGPEDTVYAGATTNPAITDANGLADFGTIPDEGDYIIAETGGGAGFVTTSENCAFTVDYPADADTPFDDCVITNTGQGNIIVVKETLPDGSTQEFEFDSDYGDNFVLTDGQSNDSGPLNAGTYSVAELGPPAGWDLTSATCDDGSVPAAIDLGPGETVTCTFTNTQRGDVDVVKTSNGGAGAGITFTLSGGPDNVLLTDVTDANGNLSFPNLKPGTYTLCEEVPLGFTSSLPNFDPVTGIACSDPFTLDPGETETFNVTNTTPGNARTIGFWKTHSCEAPGNQDDEVTPLLPQTLGNYTVSSCSVAVDILSKQNTNNQNKASDPLFNMAAQLLAAKLNIASGADGSCITATIAQADALLTAKNWNPTTGGSSLSKADKTLANSLATALDNYNNNGC